MNTQQKILILVLLIIFSISLHIFFCEWDTSENFGNWPPIYGNFDYDDEIMLYADHSINGQNSLAISIGIFTPSILIGFSIYLFLGWKKEISILFSNKEEEITK